MAQHKIAVSQINLDDKQLPRCSPKFLDLVGESCDATTQLPPYQIVEQV
jgi:hypothetical protein